MARAVTISGEATNACVCGLASLRPVKLRLYDVTIVFFSPFFISFLKKSLNIRFYQSNFSILDVILNKKN
jgi:hypothetical protein